MSSDLTVWMEDPNFLRNYLLGELAEEKVDAVERRLLADDDYFELVEAVEGDLLTDCANGALSPREHARVMRGLASSPRGKARLSASRELAILSRERPILRPAKPIPFPVNLVPTRRLAVRFAAMAAMLLAVAGGVTLSRYTTIPGGGAAMAGNRTAGALHRLQAPERIAQTPLLPVFQAPHPVPSPLPSQTSAAVTPQPSSPDRTAEAHRPPATVQELVPAALLELALATVRSGGTPRPMLIVPAGTRQIEIQLPLQEGDDFPSYRATILDADDEPVWQQKDLRSHPAADEGSIVVVSFPAARLPAGTYRLELSGVSLDGALETVGKPLFDVRTP